MTTSPRIGEIRERMEKACIQPTPETKWTTFKEIYRARVEILADVTFLLSELSRLQAENGELREALKPFAEACGKFPPQADDGLCIFDHGAFSALFTLGDLRRAASITGDSGS